MKMTYAYALAVVAIVSSGALADEKIPIKGTCTGVDNGVVDEVSKEHTVIVVRSQGLGYLLEAPNNNPMQYAAGALCGLG